jgi:SAM-dependent methyltransferase
MNPQQPPWEHPDWYDLHDDAFTAGIEREAEHYHELLLGLPPLSADDHVVDLGCGTGKLASLVAAAYPELGQMTLVEPNHAKLDRAHARVSELIPQAAVQAVGTGLGAKKGTAPTAAASVALMASVLMPVMEMQGGRMQDGFDWLDRVLGQVLQCLRPGGWLFVLDTLTTPWGLGDLNDPVRRLSLPEYRDTLSRACFTDVEVVYRFRDRVVLSARRAEA